MYWGLTTENPPVAGAWGTSPGPQPSEEGWDRSDCRCEAGSLEPSRSITVRYGSITDPLQILYSFITARYALLRLCTGSVPTPTEIRLIGVTRPRSPSRSLTCYRVEVLWTSALAPVAVALGRPPAALPTQGAAHRGARGVGTMAPLCRWIPVRCNPPGQG